MRSARSSDEYSDNSECSAEETLVRFPAGIVHYIKLAKKKNGQVHYPEKEK